MRSLGLERKKSVTFGVHEVLLLAACHRTWLVFAAPGYAKNGMWEGDGMVIPWHGLTKLSQKVVGLCTHPFRTCSF
jgi:hypothetical protein